MELSVTTTFTFTALRPFLTSAASVCREVKENNKAEAIRQTFFNKYTISDSEKERKSTFGRRENRTCGY
jgi:hypothetical protein